MTGMEGKWVAWLVSFLLLFFDLCDVLCSSEVEVGSSVRLLPHFLLSSSGMDTTSTSRTTVLTYSEMIHNTRRKNLRKRSLSAHLPAKERSETRGLQDQVSKRSGLGPLQISNQSD
ncbi:hypothetical protein V8C34DRAFT_267354 [Trichoderma compactum]